jgi:hypothetical protein
MAKKGSKKEKAQTEESPNNDVSKAVPEDEQ